MKYVVRVAPPSNDHRPANRTRPGLSCTGSELEADPGHRVGEQCVEHLVQEDAEREAREEDEDPQPILALQVRSIRSF
jgi:hypothetical protein